MANQAGRAPLDAQQFARVWKRVVKNGEASMVELNVSQTELNDGGGAALGEGTQRDGAFLQQRIRIELRRWKSFRVLASRLGENRTLMNLSAQSYRNARRLAAVLFLITGGWYLPERQSSAQRWADVRSGLRSLFRSSQQWEVEYRQAAEECGDEMLRELYIEQMGECQKQQTQIRALLERI